MIGRLARAAALTVALGAVGDAAPAAVGAAPASLSFDRTFSVAAEPAALHYQVMFVSAGRVHRMAVWRDGERRVKRVTDDALVTLATHRPGDAGYRLTVLDLARRISTRIDRTNLYRVGNFTDWFDLTHGLRHPKGAYTLLPSDPPPRVPAMVAGCRWYLLRQGAAANRLCWDEQTRLPLAILGTDGRLLWQVTALDTRPAPRRTFTIDDRGFVRNDANRDIEND